MCTNYCYIETIDHIRKDFTGNKIWVHEVLEKANFSKITKIFDSSIFLLMVCAIMTHFYF